MSKVKKSGASSRHAGKKAAESKLTGKAVKKRPKAPLKTRETPAGVGVRAAELEPMSQVTLKMRQSQHRELSQMAFDAGTTMRGIIMRALKSKGLTVTKEDLIDRRRK